jgi:hypothetical protein
LRRVMPMAMENLSIAQRRDTLRYAHTWVGNYKPKVTQFDVSDFVYFQQQPNDILNISSNHIILRIKVIVFSSGLDLKESTNAQFKMTSKIVRPATYWTWILPSSCWFGFLHLTIHVRYVKR